MHSCCITLADLDLRHQVLQDMLQLLKETVSSRHAERLETIVIWLIVVEIGRSSDPPVDAYSYMCELTARGTGLGIITILVDLFSA